MEQRKNVFLSATNVESFLTHTGQILFKLSHTRVFLSNNPGEKCWNDSQTEHEIRPRLPDSMQCFEMLSWCGVCGQSE